MSKDYTQERLDMLNRRMNIVENGSNCFERLVDFDDNTNSKILFGNPMEVAAFRNRRRCNVLDNGVISAWVNDPEYTEDGWNGQVMVYQPKFYYKVQPLKLSANTETGGQGYIMNKCIIGISDGPAPGYKLHPLFINEKGNVVDYVFLGAFEACLFDTSEGAYIEYDTVGDCSVGGDKLSSIAEVIPASGLNTVSGGVDDLGFTRTGMEVTAQNRGKGWHMTNIQAVSANQLMMALEYSFNTQLGLGNGVAVGKDNVNYNCSVYTGATAYNSPIDGSTQTLVEKEDYPTQTGSSTKTHSRLSEGESGLVDYSETGMIPQTASNWQSVSYRGMENPYGNIFEVVNGVNITGNTLGGIPYVCTDYNYSDTNTTSYKSTGITIPGSDGWIKYFGYNKPEFDWMFWPIANGAPSDGSGVIGDYLTRTNSSNIRISRLGGAWNNSSHVGGFFWNLNGDVGLRGRVNGARLMYIPQL